MLNIITNLVQHVLLYSRDVSNFSCGPQKSWTTYLPDSSSSASMPRLTRNLKFYCYCNKKMHDKSRVCNPWKLFRLNICTVRYITTDTLSIAAHLNYFVFLLEFLEILVYDCELTKPPKRQRRVNYLKGIWNNFFEIPQSQNLFSVHCAYAGKDKMTRIWPKLNFFFFHPLSPYL